MALVQITHAPDRTAYENVAKLAYEPGRPTGLLAHAAAELPDGRVQIVDVFADRAALDAFGAERIGPAFAQLGMPSVADLGGPPAAYETLAWIA